MSTVLMLSFTYFRPSSMNRAESQQVHLPISPTKNMTKILDTIRDYFKTWTGEGELIIKYVEPNTFANQYPNQEKLNTIANTAFKFNNGKIRKISL